MLYPKTNIKSNTHRKPNKSFEKYLKNILKIKFLIYFVKYICKWVNKVFTKHLINIFNRITYIKPVKLKPVEYIFINNTSIIISTDHVPNLIE